jgi:hypothetical protein
MVINKIHNLKHSQGINFIKANQPGVYFLFDVDKKLSYIGESKFPMSRILDHYSRAYQNNKKAKGIGPVFDYFRIINCKSKDSRIRQHYEKRWIRKFKTRLNYNTKNESYDLNWSELKGFILVFENFFKSTKTWYRYLNDDVMNKRDVHKARKKIKRKEHYIRTGK